MNEEYKDPLWHLLNYRYMSHPWHGVSIGEKAPEVVTSFIEMTPHDTVKYEIDKESGFIKLDRPQKYSNVFPALYGFVPKTFCDTQIAEFCMEKTGRKNIVGDGDPLDICVLTERNITHGNILLKAIPIGGFRMIDGGEADDKIVAILQGDEVYSKWKDIDDVPPSIIERLRHYFLTYKDIPGDTHRKIEITHVYGKDEALEVVKRSMVDYKTRYGRLEEELSYMLRLSSSGG
jgi:inorganic pyrophosphatase